MKKIVFDIVSHDKIFFAACKAIEKFISKNSNYEIHVVGPEKEIKKYLNKNGKIFIYDCENFLDLNRSFKENLKKNIAPNLAIDIYKKIRADCVISIGDSGYLVYASIFKIGIKNNFQRPAFMPILPSFANQKFLLVDAGANLKVNAENFLPWLDEAIHYWKIIFNSTEKPRIGILNIGTEDWKGPENLSELKKKIIEKNNINFLGFLEPNDVLEGKADIVLSDGYAGNIFLKTAEHTLKNFALLLKKEYQKNFWNSLLELLSKKIFRNIKKVISFEKTSAAIILGIKGLMFKSHGASNQNALYNSLNLAKKIIEEVKNGTK